MHIRQLVAGILLFLFLATTVGIYIRIFLAAKRSHSLQNPPNAIAGEVSRTEKKNNLKELKLAKSCFMIVLVFAFSFLPMSIISILTEQQVGNAKQRAVRFWCITILMLNSSLNSVIFFWSRPQLRKEAMEIFGLIRF
jgi:hypothetical protein